MVCVVAIGSRLTTEMQSLELGPAGDLPLCSCDRIPRTVQRLHHRQLICRCAMTGHRDFRRAWFWLCIKQHATSVRGAG